MDSLPLVVVFGATGNQGNSVARALLESGKFRVRGITRNPSSAAAQKLAALGAEMVAADQTVEAQVRAAFEGAAAAFVLTSPLDPSQRDVEYDVGCMHVRAAKEAGVRHYVWSSLPNAREISGGKYRVPRYTDKARIESVVLSAGFQHTTVVFCTWFFQNVTMFGAFSELPDGTITFNLPFPEDFVLTGIDIDDLGSGVTTIIEHPEEWGNGNRVVFEAARAPMKDWVALTAAATGRKVVMGKFSAPSSWTPEEVESLEEMYNYIAESGGVLPLSWDNTTGAKASKKPLTTWEQFLKGKSGYALPPA